MKSIIDRFHDNSAKHRCCKLRELKSTMYWLTQRMCTMNRKQILLHLQRTLLWNSCLTHGQGRSIDDEIDWWSSKSIYSHKSISYHFVEFTYLVWKPYDGKPSCMAGLVGLLVFGIAERCYSLKGKQLSHM